MGEVKSVDVSAEILARVMRIEQTVADTLKHLDDRLRVGQESLHFLDEGLRVYREQSLEQARMSIRKQPVLEIAERIRHDAELRFPHRKILDVLLGEFDFVAGGFKELHFSALVKRARVGKSMAGIYLSLLEERGYVEKRSDGYRIFYKLRR